MALLFLFSGVANAQGPQFFNNSTSTGANAIPLGGGGYATNKCQFLYGPNSLNSSGSTGTPAYNGLITTVYFRVGTYTSAVVYSDFTVSLVQNVGTATTFPSTTFGTLSPAFYQATYSLPTPVTNSWVAIPLQTPFLYDPSLSLIFELKASNSVGGTSTSNGMLNGPGSRLYAAYSAITGTAATGTLVDFGFDLMPSAPCSGTPTAGTATVSNANPCMGSSISLNLSGNSIGGGQTYQWQSSASSSGPWANIDTARLTPFYTLNSTTTLYYRAKVRCNNDSTYSLPILVTVPAAFPGGTYTIDSSLPASSTNFQTFAAAISAIGCGISGPIVFNVANDTFNEQIIIPATVGSNATNTVTFNGNGALLTSPGSASNYATFAIDGADYITVNNLRIHATGATNGFGVHLANASNNNTFDSCDIVASTTATGTTSCGIVMSGSRTVYSTGGANGSNNTFSFCNVTGGYFGITLYGTTASSNANNIVTNCLVKDF
ncbi:MAG TPA: hypothetical protein PL009_12050 [Flavipsychrobacter sp.]|nr:hypothetical protein [Flavipsychrobacter sp.]